MSKQVFSQLSLSFFLVQTAVYVLGPNALASNDPDSIEYTTCSQSKIKELLAPATSKRKVVTLNCSVKLSPDMVITKGIRFTGAAASGEFLDCNNALVEPTFDDHAIRVASRARLVDGEPDRPEDIMIQNCKIKGRVDINGNQPEGLKANNPDYVKLKQAYSPTRIVLRNLDITYYGKDAVYFHQGVTHSILEDSTLSGKVSGVPLYLAPEGGHNIIRNNYFKMETKSREVLAIDGSKWNKIYSNRFSGLGHGGIYIFRNCGEDGKYRVQRPQYNQIVNNNFYYRSYANPATPAIWVGSRNHINKVNDYIPFGWGYRDYCDEDNNSDNSDHANHTSIMQNVITTDGDWFFYGGGVNIDQRPTHQYANQVITNSDFEDAHDGKGALSAATLGKAGCYKYGTQITPAMQTHFGLFLKHGQYTIKERLDEGQEVSTGDLFSKSQCNDGIWSNSSKIYEATVKKVHARTQSNNRGIQTTTTCPVGKEVVALRVGCNLESMALRGLEDVSWNSMKVINRSDNRKEGKCEIIYTDKNGRSQTESISTGTRLLQSVLMDSRSSLEFRCREKDKNGGDCSVKAEVICL